MPAVSLALLWHQHQPYYPDDVSGETLMPWVRLHGTKDYYGMALHLKEVPEFRCTVNLVPSLLVQIERYVNGGSDRHLDVTRMPADGLSEADASYLLEHFFMANVENMIRPFPRYRELLLKRGAGIDPVENALPRFSERDLRDLQVWSNLTWFHPLCFDEDAELAAFREKGKGWTEKEKSWLLDKQREILGRIIPLHRELAETGQIELTTTPFYHPILPLLWDKKSAREGMPGCELPQYLESYANDVHVQIRRAVAYHEKLFGAPPAGMWPSEGSVSQAILPAIAEAGINWIATDEEILSHSTEGWVSRDAHGHMRHPEMLFRPWKVAEGDKSLAIVFRDHALSDLIGFHYQRSDPNHAANDMLDRVEGIGRAVQPASGGRPALVPVILDGENCWEYYPDGGVQFLRSLYRGAVQRPHIRPVRVRDHLDEHPPTDTLGRLFAGSWIAHDFAIWIGHQEDRTAWDLLHETREFLKQQEASGKLSAQAIEQAWEELLIAEGSDWFWWYGDDHNSALDSLFDQLFRKHLENVYVLLDAPIPSMLRQPITRTERRAIHTQPTGFVHAKLDGRHSYFEWVNAGRYEAGSERGTMTKVSEGLIRAVWMGFDPANLFLRIDAAGSAAEAFHVVDELRIVFREPEGFELRVTEIAAGEPRARLWRDGTEAPRTEVAAAAQTIVEISVALSALGVKPGDPIRLHVEALSHGHSLDRAPSEGMIELVTPSPDFETIMWQV